MGRAETTHITTEQVESYLRRSGYTGATLKSLTPLGGDAEGGLKSYGYGRPLQAVFESGGEEKSLVVRTMAPDPFGHDRRADRADAMLLSHDTFHLIPQHIRAVDVGAFDDAGEMRSMGTGEVFLVTDFVEGKLYAKDLFRLQEADRAGEVDLERARALAAYLADLHAEKVDPQTYVRHLRDTVGSGEGIFGISDGYAGHEDVAGVERRLAFENAANRWRHRLLEHAERACRTHGDFHPFNILFREGTDFSVLDCSRGAVGEAADDVTCLSINYLFFALNHRGAFDGGLRRLWDAFWESYLERSGDDAVLKVVAPYFAWRALVLASPVWYPNLEAATRESILRFAERLLDGEAFSPVEVDALLP